jgi:hypothetical protein
MTLQTAKIFELVLEHVALTTAHTAEAEAKAAEESSRI